MDNYVVMEKGILVSCCHLCRCTIVHYCAYYTSWNKCYKKQFSCNFTTQRYASAVYAMVLNMSVWSMCLSHLHTAVLCQNGWTTQRKPNDSRGTL